MFYEFLKMQKTSSEKYSELPNLENIFVHMTYAPGYTSDKYSGMMHGYTPEEKIDAFASSYRVWVLQFAEAISTHQNSGFAVLTTLNAYPEMIAQLKGIKGDKLTLFGAGLEDVFPEIIVDYQEEITQHLYAYLRNSLAHMGLTSVNIILNGNIAQPLAIGTLSGKFAIVVNPKEWLTRITSHFDSYIESLTVPENFQLRNAFLTRLKQPF